MGAIKAKGMDAEEKKWRAEEDLRTLKYALEIIRDEERMAAVRKLAKEQRKDLEKIEDEEYFASVGLAKK